MRILFALITIAGVCAAQKVSTQELLRLARMRAPGLEQAVRDSLGADNIQRGTAAAGEMGDFVFAVAAEKGPSLQINSEAPVAAFKAGSLWVVLTRLNTGTAYKYTWISAGKPIGGANNLAAFGPDSYAQPTCGSMYRRSGMA
jgi:hypothetical protein